MSYGESSRFLHDSMDSVSGQEQSVGQQLESVLEQCIHFTGGSEFNEPLRLRRLKERFPGSYQQLEGKLKEVVGPLLGTIPIGSFGPTKKYLSQVLRYDDGKHRTQVLRRLRDGVLKYPGQIFIWTDEGDHIHLVHDCPCSNGSCRCGIFKGEEFRGTFRTNLRGSRFINELDTIDWINVLLYFVYSKWPCESQIWTRGRLRRSPSTDEIVRWKCLQREVSGTVLDGEEEGIRYNDQLEDAVRKDVRDNIHESAEDAGEQRRQNVQTSGKRKRGLGETKTSKFQRILQEVESLLDECAVIPPIHVKELFSGPRAIELHNPTNQKYYEGACSLWGMKFLRWTLKDIADFYKNKSPVFYANDINPFVYYHDMESSVYFIDSLLRHQFGGDDDIIAEFLGNMRDWFNKYGWNGNPKINAICIIGPPNSGKNYFFDMWAALACNVGHIGRVNNKTNRFALQDCVNRRLVMGNEISMEDGAKEDFKKLCEGSAVNIAVKFQGDKIFTKTPVLLISNFVLDICNDSHFRDVRLKTMRWQTAELLKDSVLKPYPLCLFKIYEKYNVSLQ